MSETNIKDKPDTSKRSSESGENLIKNDKDKPRPTPPPRPAPPNKQTVSDDIPQVPTPEETPVVPEAPAAVASTAVVTTSSGLKFGWQQPAVRAVIDPEPCFHMGIVQARKQLVEHDEGHEWACTCGDVFEVAYNLGGKKILREKGA